MSAQNPPTPPDLLKETTNPPLMWSNCDLFSLSADPWRRPAALIRRAHSELLHACQDHVMTSDVAPSSRRLNESSSGPNKSAA